MEKHLEKQLGHMTSVKCSTYLRIKIVKIRSTLLQVRRVLCLKYVHEWRTIKKRQHNCDVAEK